MGQSTELPQCSITQIPRDCQVEIYRWMCSISMSIYEQSVEEEVATPRLFEPCDLKCHFFCALSTDRERCIVVNRNDIHLASENVRMTMKADIKVCVMTNQNWQSDSKDQGCWSDKITFAGLSCSGSSVPMPCERQENMEVVRVVSLPRKVSDLRGHNLFLIILNKLLEMHWALLPGSAGRDHYYLLKAWRSRDLNENLEYEASDE